MAMHADNRHSRRENSIGVVQRFLCCSCFKTGENDHLEYNQERSQIPKAIVDEENILIVVEDLGVDNLGFSLSEVEHCSPPQQISMGRSASSVSMCQRAALKKKLAPLSSLPLQSRVIQNSEDDSTVDSLLYGSSSTNFGDGSLLTPPVINLIPPTPSDVIDDDQFFDINSEEDSLHQTSGSEGVDSIGSAAMGEQESEEDVDQDLESEGNHKSKDEEHPQVEPPEEETAKKKTIDKSTIHFLRSTFHVPPLPEYPRKRSLNTGISLLQFTEHNLGESALICDESSQ
ncbi:uncharacterized protein LOC127969785 [Carassius gibelio]|uniref:uncharacterized protein LOC127969785 n=1 Tax=Carassius gibelio TaxID=101364 RepID=UPI0022775060|nr:uncharacterized protein LOC127969785 [Carassius gibelio]